MMKPVHSYHVPTYSIVPPYQFARYEAIFFMPSNVVKT